MSIYDNLVQGDIHSIVGSLKGYKRRMSDGRYVVAIEKMATDHSWVYTNANQIARCDIYQKVFFRKFNMISSRCRKCWKVCVNPTPDNPMTVKDLFGLHDIQKGLGSPAKCGLNDARPYVFGMYAGYWYTISKDEGLERKDLVQGLTSLPVILKRYCTEFEYRLGPSDKLPDMTNEDLEFEKGLLALFPRGEELGDQPPDLVTHMKKKWIDLAYSVGDKTYLEFTDGKPLYPECVTYE